MADFCGDNRFELIEKYKQKLIEETNIESAPDEMKVLNDILFRFWQMGWLIDKDTNVTINDCISRQGAIDALTEYGNGRAVYISVEEAVRRMEQLPSAQQWIPCSEHPDTDRNVFIARGKTDLLSCCIGHYDHNAKLWYEDRNWFAKIMYDAMYWCEMPPLPEPWKGEQP